jgi:protein-tyrosine phosphatase
MMTLSIILDDKLATDGIQYSYSYLLEGYYQPDTKSTDSWKVVDVRRLRDDDSNTLDDYKKYIDLCFEAIKEQGKVAICCSYGVSRSNAIALGVLVKYYDMNFIEALQLIKHKVKKSNIKEIHITKLKKLLGEDKKNSLNKISSDKIDFAYQ